MRHTLFILTALFLPLLAVAEIQWLEQPIRDNVTGANGVVSVDMDNDGDLDVLVTSYGESPDYIGELCWYENLVGSGTIWETHLISNTVEHATSPVAVDIDGDGDLDAICVQENYAIGWWENLDGSGTSWSANPIELSSSESANVVAADIDGDGDMDLAGSSNAAQPFEAIKWWANTAGDGSAWSSHTVESSWEAIHFVTLDDVNGDGDIDLITVDRMYGDVIWFDNMYGDGSSWSDHTIASGFQDGRMARLDDMDGDGDMDVVAASTSSDEIVWWDNLDGLGTSWLEQSVDSDFNSAYAVYPLDLDADGDMDLAGTAASGFPSYVGQVAWWENVDGLGTSWTRYMIEPDFSAAWGLAVGDMNGDAAFDIIATSAEYNAVTWWEQRGSGPVEVILTPLGSTDLPANGGTLSYEARVISYLPGTYENVSFWTKVKLPNGNFYPPVLSYVTFTLAPYIDLSAPVTQQIPAMAPAGNYELWGWLGYHPNYGPSFNDFFPFTKSAAASSGAVVDGWDAHGSFVTDQDTEPVTRPSAFALRPAYPNPFNAMATVSVEVPERADLSVRVVNITGQQVAELAHGSYQSGVHEFAFDATGLASGIYFVHATVPGQLNAVKKVMLVR